MLKPIERMHTRNRFVQIGCSCMGQHLIACYRTLKDDSTGKSFCMMMRWSGHDCVHFNVQQDDELMHLFFEDNGCDFARERELDEHGNLSLSDEVTNSAVYQRVYRQLFNGISRQLEEEGVIVHDDLTTSRK